MSENGCLTTLAATSGIVASGIAVLQYAETHNWWHFEGFSIGDSTIWGFIKDPGAVTGNLSWWAVLLWVLGLYIAIFVANLFAGDSLAPGAAVVTALLVGVAWVWFFWAAAAVWVAILILIGYVIVAVTGYFMGENL